MTLSADVKILTPEYIMRTMNLRSNTRIYGKSKPRKPCILHSLPPPFSLTVLPYTHRTHLSPNTHTYACTDRKSER